MAEQTSSLSQLRPGHYVHAARGGGLIFLSGLPGNAEGGLLIRSLERLPPEGRRIVARATATPREELIAAQAWRALTNMRTVLEQQGVGLGQLVRLNAYTPVPDRFGAVERVVEQLFGDARPVVSCIPVEEVGRAREVEIALYPIVAEASAEVGRVERVPDDGVDQSARGAAACRAAGLIWVPLLTPRPTPGEQYGDTLQASPAPEGERLLDPAAERKARVARQTRTLLEGLGRRLEAAGSRLGQLVRLGVYLRDIADREAFVEAARPLFGEAAPACTIVQQPANGPCRASALVELDGLAAIDGVDIRRWQDAAAPGFGSAMCQAGPLLFVAGLLPLAAEGAPRIARGYGDVPIARERLGSGVDHPDEREGQVVAQGWALFERLRALLGQRQRGFGDLVNLSYFLADIGQFPSFNRVVRSMLPVAAHTSIIVQLPALAAGAPVRASLEATALLE